MNVAYGPPGQSGVTTLMHVGQDSTDAESTNIHKLAGTVGIVSVGVWALASVTGNSQLRSYAFATSVMAFITRLATRPK